MPDVKYQWEPDVVVRDEGEESFLFNAETAAFIVVNETARFIWDRCEKGATVQQVAAHLVRAYEVDMKTAEKDVEEHVKQLVDRKFLRAE